MVTLIFLANLAPNHLLVLQISLLFSPLFSVHKKIYDWLARLVIFLLGSGSGKINRLFMTCRIFSLASNYYEDVADPSLSANLQFAI